MLSGNEISARNSSPNADRQPATRLARLPVLRLAPSPVPNAAALQNNLHAFEDLCRRPRESHAKQMKRGRRPGIFTSWPSVLNGDHPRPFAIGMTRELLVRLDERRCTAATLRRPIRQLTCSWCCQNVLAAHGAQRHDVNGRPVGRVSDDHANHGVDRLRAMRRERR